MKIESEYELMKKKRKAIFENLINKFKNRKFELDMQQKQENNLHDNENKMRASKFFLKYFYFLRNNNQ